MNKIKHISYYNKFKQINSIKTQRLPDDFKKIESMKKM